MSASPGRLKAVAIALATATAGSTACAPSSDGADERSADGGGPIDLGSETRRGRAGSEAREGGAPFPDGGGATDEPVSFATEVVSFDPGACAGFGADSMPDIVLGPPQGAGDRQGSLHVVSLGTGGEIVLSFGARAIVDRPGVDLIVYENAFYAGDGEDSAFTEPAEVSVSDDGISWSAFPCTGSAPYPSCAGLRPVYATPDEVDPTNGGGDPFDLATLGLKRIRFVRIRDKTAQRCTSLGPNTNGFDLDAVAAVHSDE